MAEEAQTGSEGPANSSFDEDSCKGPGRGWGRTPFASAREAPGQNLKGSARRQSGGAARGGLTARSAQAYRGL